MATYKNLSSLILHNCGIKNIETVHFKELFEKSPKLVYLDVRHNEINVEMFIKYIYLLPELYYLFMSNNSTNNEYISLLRKYEYTGLIDPWIP